MRNSPDFLPLYENSSNERGPDKTEELADFGRAPEIMNRRDTGEAVKLELLRAALSRVAAQKEKGFILVGAEGNSLNTFRAASETKETKGVKPRGGLRRWVSLALAGLGFVVGGKLQAADSNAPQKPDSIVAGVPVFKATTQPNTGTNVYNYQGETWKPKTEAEKEKMLKARAALEAQAAAAKAGNTLPPSSYGQHQQRIENPAPNIVARPEIRQNQSLNTGHYPNTSEGRFINSVNSPRPDDVVFIQGQGGIHYPEPSYPQHNNYGMRGRYSNMPMPSTVYYGVPPGRQIPKEKRRFLGEDYDDITRDAALGISGSD